MGSIQMTDSTADAVQPSAHRQIFEMLKSMQIYPMEISLPVMGMSYSTYLTSVAGLSPARVSKGGFDRLRPSTSMRMEQRAQEYALAMIKGKGWPEEVGEALLKTVPVCSAGRPATFAAFLHYLQRPEGLQLPLSIGFALDVAELIFALLDAHQADDCVEFANVVTQFLAAQQWNELSTLCGRSFDEVWGQWEAVVSWTEVKPLCDQFLTEVLFSYLAAVDVEWADYYFSGGCDRPVLPLVAPKPTAKALSGERLKPKEGLLFRPVRRLFEFSAGLIYRSHHKEWPRQAPNARELAWWMNEDEEVVYNYLDGSKQLTAQDFESRWDALFFGITGDAESFATPNLLALFAIGWQATLINRGKDKKIKSFVFFTDELPCHWQMYRRRWQDQLQVAERTLEWPDWLVS